jgi:rubrerythrin
MPGCRHAKLELLSTDQVRLRCQRCHLTLASTELEGGYCPECFEQSGKRHYAFEELPVSAAAVYRCEECGAIVPC